MNKIGQGARLARVLAINSNVGSRAICTSPKLYGVSDAQIPKRYFEIRKRMEMFQIDNGVPVHLKGGVFDHVLYYFTLGLSVVCLMMIGKYVYTASFPKKR